MAATWRGSGAAAAGPGDVLAQGVWLAGDTHVHTDHSSDGSGTRQGSNQVLPGNVSVADQIGQAERMGLQYLPLTDHRTYDQHWDPLWTSSSLLLIPGEEANGSPHATVHGSVDEVIDGAGVPGSHAYRHIQQSIWEVRAQGAVWCTAHPDDGEYSGGRTNDNAEAVGMSSVEVWNRGSSADVEIDYAENRWNAGWRFGGVGGCDCHFRELWGVAGPGMPTTFVHVTEASERGVLEAFRAGHTSIAANPVGTFLTLEADLNGDGRFEVMGGDEVTHLPAGRRGMLRVRVQRGAGGTVVVLAAPGRSKAPVFTSLVTEADQTFLVPVTVPRGFGWWRAEVRSDGAPSSFDITDLEAGSPGTVSVLDQLQAFVSPVFTSTGGPASPRQRLSLPVQRITKDHAKVVLGPRGSFTGFPDVAVARPGTKAAVVHLVAERHVAGATTVVHAIAGGRAKETVLTASRAARFPRVAVSGDWVHVVWQDERTGQVPRHGDVWLRSSRDGGRTWLPERKISTSAGRSERPAIAVNSADPSRPWIVWADNSDVAASTPAVLGTGQHGFDVWVARPGEAPRNLSGAGKTSGPGNGIDTRSARWPASLHPSVTVRRDGGVVVGWQDNRFDPHPLWTGATPPLGSTDGGDQSLPDAWEPMVAVLAPHGSWSAPLRVAPDPAASARHPQVLATPDGKVVAVWSWKKLKAADANLGLRGSVSSDGGKTWSAPVAIDSAPAAMSARPRLGVTASGAARVVWADTRSTDWRWRVRTAVLTGPTWRPGGDLTNHGNGCYPAVAHDVVVAVTDRNALVQRDATQQIAVVDLRH